MSGVRRAFTRSLHEDALKAMDEIMQRPLAIYFIRSTESNELNPNFYDSTYESIDLCDIRDKLATHQYRDVHAWRADITKLFSGFKKIFNNSIASRTIASYFKKYLNKKFAQLEMLDHDKWTILYNDTITKLNKTLCDLPGSMKYLATINGQAIQGVPKIYKFSTELPEFLYPENKELKENIEPGNGNNGETILNDELLENNVDIDQKPSFCTNMPCMSSEPDSHDFSPDLEVYADMFSVSSPFFSSDFSQFPQFPSDSLLFQVPKLDEKVECCIPKSIKVKTTSTPVKRVSWRSEVIHFLEAIEKLNSSYDAQKIGMIIAKHETNFDFTAPNPEIDFNELKISTFEELLDYVKGRYEELQLDYPDD